MREASARNTRSTGTRTKSPSNSRSTKSPPTATAHRCVDAVAFAEIGTQAGGDEIQRILAQRRATDAYIAPSRCAVFSSPRSAGFERGLGHLRRTQQQQQPPTHVRAVGGGLSSRPPVESGSSMPNTRLEQFARGRELAGMFSIPAATVPAQHVPYVFMAAAGHRQDLPGRIP